MSKLLRIADVADRTGLTIGTVRNYCCWGILPPPRQRVGTVMFFAAEDIAFYMKTRRDVRKPRRKHRH
jgi:predicted site-specific integrase-resolvase